MSDQKTCPTCGTEYPLSERFCPRDGTALRSTNAAADLIGSVVAERYHILKKLGEGGMGTVYLAEHVKMGRKAALKVMNPGMNSDPDAIARFNREAANASRLNHPNVCGIYDFGETPEGLIYLAMEFIEGQSLTSLIEKNGALAAPRAASIIHQAADALAVAHDYGIVHRDLKPDNIMIAKGRDNSDQVKVVDFGIAKASSSDAQKVTKTGLVVGTPEYMSPEQLAGDKLDGRSDIYSLGLVAFNCLTGKLPFPSNSAQEAMIMRLTDHPKSLAEMKPDVEWPDALQAVMDKALARDAAERYQGAAEFGRDMVKAVENMPATVAGEGATMVIGAAGAAAATAAVPRTRVADPSPVRGGKTVPTPAISAPVVPAPVAAKSKTPMMVGAAVVIAAIGIGGYLMMPKGGAAGTNQGATQGSKLPDNKLASGADTAGSSRNAASRVSTAAANAARPPGTKTDAGSKAPGKAPVGVGKPEPPASGGATGAASFDPSSDVAAIQKLTITGKEADAASALPLIGRLLPKLKNADDSATVLFERANAFLTIDGNHERACPIFLKIRDVPSVAAGVASAIKAIGCK